MNRPLVGIIALVLLAAAGVIWWLQPRDADASAGAEHSMWLAACLRIGLLMGAIWLALPQLSWAPNWTLKLALFFGLALMVFFGKGKMVFLAAAIYLLVMLVRASTAGPSPPRVRPADAGRGGA